METHDADVVIIGGGPAGATLGALAANGRLNVIVVERAVYPREHVGELLMPSVNAVLHRIGLLTAADAVGFVRRDGVAWTAPRMPEDQALSIHVAAHPPPRALRRYGFNVERDAFDTLLLRHAQTCGARVLEGMTARRVIFDGDRAVAVEVQESDGGIHRLTGRFIVDASGRRCLLAAQLKLLARGHQPRHCAMYSWFESVAPPPHGGTTYAWMHVLDHHRAWAWQIPLRHGLTSVGVVAAGDRFQGTSRHQDALFQQMIDQNPAFTSIMATARRVQPWRTVADYDYQVQAMHGRGWLLLGDAAGFIDPIFASGVDIAMHSAVLAYESLLPLLLLGNWTEQDEQFSLARYESRVREGTAVWAKAVNHFYHSLRDIRLLPRQTRLIPAICRFLQGNPYELQNQLLFQQLLDQVDAYRSERHSSHACVENAERATLSSTRY